VFSGDGARASEAHSIATRPAPNNGTPEGPAVTTTAAGEATFRFGAHEHCESGRRQSERRPDWSGGLDPGDQNLPVIAGVFSLSITGAVHTLAAKDAERCKSGGRTLG
jgi:hypothetical protein